MHKVSKQLAISFDRLEDWEIQQLINLCQQELTERAGAPPTPGEPSYSDVDEERNDSI